MSKVVRGLKRKPEPEVIDLTREDEKEVVEKKPPTAYDEVIAAYQRKKAIEKRVEKDLLAKGFLWGEHLRTRLRQAGLPNIATHLAAMETGATGTCPCDSDLSDTSDEEEDAPVVLVPPKRAL